MAGRKKSEPLSALSRALLGEGDRHAARKGVSELVRALTWDRLPVRFKGIVRADIAALNGGRPALADVLAAGYSGRVARQALREIGQG